MMNGQVIPPGTIKNAHKAVGAGRAELALSLVGYDAELEQAMRYVLGRTMVISFLSSARLVRLLRVVYLLFCGCGLRDLTNANTAPPPGVQGRGGGEDLCVLRGRACAQVRQQI